MPDTKVNQLCGHLRTWALERGPDAKLPTVREMQTLYRANQVTLNEALNRLEAQRVIYRKARSGIFVSPKIHHRTVAVLLDSSFFSLPGLSPFWGHLWGLLASEAQARAEADALDFVFQLVPPIGESLLPDTLRQTIENKLLHAVLGVGIETEPAKWLAARVPFVNFAGPGGYTVNIEGSEVARIGVPLLAAQGCQRISLWISASPLRVIRPEQPFQGETIGAFQEQARKLKGAADAMPIFDSREVVSGQPLHFAITQPEQGYRAAMRVFRQPRAQWPDGLVVQEDMMTVGILAALRQLDIRPAQDVHIVTHANAGSTTLFGYEDVLMRVEVEPQEIVRAMFALLDTLLAGREPDTRFALVQPRYVPFAPHEAARKGGIEAEK